MVLVTISTMFISDIYFTKHVEFHDSIVIWSTDKEAEANLTPKTPAKPTESDVGK